MSIGIGLEKRETTPPPAVSLPPDRFGNVPVRKLTPSPSNPRKHLDEAKLNELAASIREHGINQPLLIRPLKDDEFEIVAGERRFRAAQRAGLKEVPCIIRELTDEQALEIQAIENLQREDLTPVEEANGYQQLIDRNHYDVGAIAAKVGKSASYVYGRLSLLRLCPEGREALEEETGKFTLQHAMIVAKLREEDQARAVDFCTRSYTRVSVAMLRQQIADTLMRVLSQAPFDLGNTMLLAGAGSCTGCNKRTAAQPGLFDDIAEPDEDRCLDADCYGKKVDNHIEQIRAKMAAKDGTRPPLVAERGTYGQRRPGVVEDWNWTSATAKTPGAQRAVIANGSNAGKVVWAKFTRGALDSPDERRRKAEEQRKRQDRSHNSWARQRQLQQTLGPRLMQEVHQRIEKEGEPESQELRGMVLRYVFDTDEEGCARLLKWLGIGHPPAPRRGVRHHADLAVDAIRNERDLSSDSVFAAVITRTFLADDRKYDCDQAVAIAKACGVDVAAIEKAVKREMKDAEKAKKSPKKQEPTQPAKKTSSKKGKPATKKERSK